MFIYATWQPYPQASPSTLPMLSPLLPFASSLVSSWRGQLPHVCFRLMPPTVFLKHPQLSAPQSNSTSSLLGPLRGVTTIHSATKPGTRSPSASRCTQLYTLFFLPEGPHISPFQHLCLLVTLFPYSLPSSPSKTSSGPLPSLNPQPSPFQFIWRRAQGEREGLKMCRGQEHWWGAAVLGIDCFCNFQRERFAFQKSQLQF